MNEKSIAEILSRLPRTDARYLLPPLKLPDSPRISQSVPEFTCVLRGSGSISGETISQIFAPTKRLRMETPRLRGKFAAQDAWQTLLPDRVIGEEQFDCIEAAWDLSWIAESTPTDSMRRAARLVQVVSDSAAPFGVAVTMPMPPSVAGQRAFAIVELKDRFARAIEMRLTPKGRLFPSLAVWESALALGLNWNPIYSLFEWRDVTDTTTLFTVSAPQSADALLPERALEGSGTAYLALSFDLVSLPLPLLVYDSMAVALAYFGRCLNGTPQTSDGRLLDSEQVDRERSQLELLIAEMATAEYIGDL